jgi:PAS domain S-box-containing protein
MPFPTAAAPPEDEHLLAAGEVIREVRTRESLLKTGALHDAIFHSATFSCIATDAKGNIQIFNVGAERMLGYAEMEVVNRITAADLHDPAEVIARAAALSREFATPIAPGFEALAFKAARGLEDIYELTQVRKDGSRFPAIISVTALRNAENGIIGYLLIGTDNTARHLVEEEREKFNQRLRDQRQALSASEVRYRRLFETAKDGILILDADTGMVVDVNPFLITLLGYSREQFLGKAIWDLGFFADIVANEDKFRELRETEYVRYEKPLKTSAGRRIDVEFISNVYLVEGSKVIQCNVRDISERRRAEEAVRLLYAELEQRVVQRTAELEAANKELEAFSYSVSHDLRAPLRAVDGFSQAVLEDFGALLPDEGRRYLQTIRSGAQRMGALVDDLLAFARLSRQSPDKRPVNTDQLVRTALAELGSPWPDRELEVRLGVLPASSGDPALLKQVWLNLLSNALKYTRKKKHAVVEIGSVPTDGIETFFVRDNGTGFDLRYADKLFGVFQRLHRVEDYEGTGVGLAIVQRIVQRHGGRVWAEAAVDRGATFYFTLEPPLKP